MAASDFILGLDIGGTKVAAGIFDSHGNQLSAERIPTQAPEGPDAVIRRTIDLLHRTVASARLSLSNIAAIGVGCVGPLDAEAGVIQAPPNLPGWNNTPLVDHLRRAMERPVFLDNDANAACLAEHRYGAGRGTTNLLYLTLSTGVGGGAIVDGRLFRGKTGNAGELGHVSVHYRGRLCNCGNRGCIEAYASGTAIAERAREAMDASSMLAPLGAKISCEHVVEAVRQGDALARRIWDETVELLGTALVGFINTFDPERVVLGGGVTLAGPLLFDPLREWVRPRVLTAAARDVELLPAQLGDQVGVFGGAAVALDKLGR